jgi:glutamate-ammonia-ligase adenylyltransferase
MDELAERLIADLQRGEPADERELLAAAGDPDPAQAARAFRSAARDADLAGSLPAWVPALLHTARPGYGASCLAEIAGLRRDAGRRLDLGASPALPLVIGSSTVLARALLRHPEWVDDLVAELPAPPAAAPVDADWTAIRRTKYRGLLRIAARDLLARPFAASLAELSDLADRCLDAALRCAAEETGLAPPALFALGKLGGRELNFSSDVDLLFLYTTRGGVDESEQIRDASAVVRCFQQGLEEPSPDGFAYRVDLDLRPEGRTGVLVNSVDAALGFYESFGAEWERQMLIRLRGVAGPAETLAAFAEGITPFVYRRLIDPSVMTNVRRMKMRIEEERVHAGRDLEADLKEGPGGIRDIEFIVQSLVLFHGGHHAALRTGNVLDSLAVLRDLELLPEEITASLTACYLWLRRAEHCVQLAEEQQTARFPRDAAAQVGLARRMGYRQPEGRSARENLLEEWSTVRTEVRSHFDALVLSGDA